MADLNYSDITELIKSKSLDEKAAQIRNSTNIWKQLVTYLHDKEQSELGNTPIQQSDFENNISLFRTINNNIDMDAAKNGSTTYSFDKVISDIKAAYGDDDVVDNTNYFWNESVRNAIHKWIKAFDYGNTNGPINADSDADAEFYISNIKNGNAGKSFNGTAWVQTNTNIDGKTYDAVRGSDKIESVLNNEKEMQFTHTQTQSNTIVNKYLRLLMPKYLRRVEVEDLNRNFWVIGQTISAISAFLFNDDSPIKELFKDLLSEITQLWENVLYLWAGMAMLENKGKKSITKVHTEVVYLPNNEFEDHLSYDDFALNDATWAWNSNGGILDRLAYLIDSYPECNLCIIPVIRYQNYEHNYYKGENWAGIVFYDRNHPYAGKHGFYYVTWWDSVAGKNFGYRTVSDIDLESSGSGFSVKSDDKIEWIYPFTGLMNYEATTSLSFLFAVRTIPTINCTYNINNGFILNKSSKSDAIDDGFRVDFIDVGLDMHQRATRDDYSTNLNNRRIAYLRLNSNLTIAPGLTMNNSVTSSIIDKMIWIADYSGEVTPSTQLRTFSLRNKGFYRGELMSTEGISEAKYNLGITNVPLIPLVGDSLTLNTDGNRYGETATGLIQTILNNSSMSAKINYNPNELHCYIGSHKNALFKNNDTTISSLNGYFNDDPKWIATYPNNKTYNSNREVYKTGLILETPWGERYLYNNYKYISLIPPTLELLEGEEESITFPDGSIRNGFNRSSRAVPSKWEGGRTCASFITLETIKNDKAIEFNRNRDLLTYYYVWTPNGEKPTKESKFYLFLNQITVIYGMFPEFYKGGRPLYPNSIITEKTSSNGSYTGQQRTVQVFNSEPQIFLQTNDRKAITENGRQRSGEFPNGWDDEVTLNESAFISQYKLGFPVNTHAFNCMLSKLKEHKVFKNLNKIKQLANDNKYLSVTYIYTDKVRKYSSNKEEWEYQPINTAYAGDITKEDDGNYSLEITIYGPISWSKESYSFDTIEQHYYPSMLEQFYYINNERWDEIDINATGGVSTYYGSVMDIKTYRFEYDGTANQSDKFNAYMEAWYSRFYGNSTNNGYELTSTFSDVTGGGSVEMLDRVPENWKLAYCGDLNGEGIKSSVAKIIANTSVNKNNFERALVASGGCPYFDKFHYNGYNSHTPG